MAHEQHNEGEFGAEPIRGMLERRDTGPSEAAPTLSGQPSPLAADGRDIRQEPRAAFEMGTDPRLDESPPFRADPEPLDPPDSGAAIKREDVETGASVVSALSALAGVL